ncbi:glycoside hydrolase family 16 protein [Shewanella pneumatophori]|uniref:Glycoside hydrolase family 16 protein n=1 Tax=Shewanella pneumatophori TaxID=314092 RepID=A0A9X2CF27_9GAMM|nr:glycoside hydrolase family 16 protein [Shewanella pneumatophori]MCL1139532.1 glycoside hydrolase family 16 protein [Shewanella pneumatophori]
MWLFFITVLGYAFAAFHNNSAAQVNETNVSAMSSDWQLVWQDEFNDKHIDLTKWSFEYNCYGGGNNEHQCYTDRAENAFVNNGHLHIVARLESFSGPALKDDHLLYQRSDVSVSKPFTSARMRTVYKGDWSYGRFEVRAKFPKGQGTWGAVWMLPTDWHYGEWSGSGEIDIVEAINLGTASDRVGALKGELETRIHGTLHYGQPWPNNVYSGQSFQLPNGQSPAAGFHLYALEWQPDEIRWYVDNIHYATQTSKTWFTKIIIKEQHVLAKQDAPFNKRFHLLLNLAVGGDWAENANDKGVDLEAFPQTLLVDYVRVYQKQN